MRCARGTAAAQNKESTMRLRTAFAIAAIFALAGCDQAFQMAGQVAKDAKEQVAASVDTKTACTLAGQNEQFCGCVQTELGPKLTQEHMDAAASVIKSSIGGDVGKAAEAATNIDPKTREALTKCAVQGAIGAAQEEAGQ
jgi:hypothetical protein